MIPAPPPAGRKLPCIGRYELVAGIASGGMGSVLLARLAAAGGFQRLVAIKLPHPHFVHDAEVLGMLLDEARIAACIHHPNVVGIQEVNESAEHGYYLVMDYVEGFSLADVLDRATALPAARRWRIAIRALLDALAGLHAAHVLTDDLGRPLGVVHRDVSPQNVLVGVDGIARVTDFGIAKAAARIARTAVGQLKGKAAYMSPEQVRAQPEPCGRVRAGPASRCAATPAHAAHGAAGILHARRRRRAGRGTGDARGVRATRHARNTRVARDLPPLRRPALPLRLPQWP
jgi:serine/threonine protein kinase